MENRQEIINHFIGEYFFLSNFYPSEVRLDGETYPSVEHAFQAAKTGDALTRKSLHERGVSAALARSIGRSVHLRPDWECVKVDIMLDLLRQKFSSPEMAKRLLATGDAWLEEGNKWGDRFWGTVNGEGENVLGILLQIVRLESQK